ncbi:hypothetical protein ACH34E_01945 [Elizabethkingia anophelis]|uniref:hypothetical protein n=1 Tax=Elizabethkingia anophelis TaxID=1117645 RepID=UPI00099B1D27|nr:hypothetical protein [Elizabethkingia anophelis]MCT4120149.1 hypothetical protein [Elizabethkingia anophelis]MCT4220270.1 hypothetical protein [Elizabethkingia anophelis]MDV3602154.1 hypothetical protein [Elizabethkingia anophelis]OPC51344.1 hypothetical protein BAY05_00840 [Elizabethkingia anophelis]
MNFKILAIRPLENSEGLKNLQKGHLYQFYNNYYFSPGDEVIIESNEVPESLFSSNITQSITIGAIVGKNGSGKSAIIELLIKAIVKISLILKDKFINSEDLFESSDGKDKFRKSIDKDLSNLHLEIYYISKMDRLFIDTNGNLKPYAESKKVMIRKIVLSGNSFNFTDYLKNNNRYEKSAPFDSDLILKSKYEEDFLEDFFYSMIVNYSFYGFNNKEIGDWIQGVFHKNDGYQLPVVINPFRNNGNIDINSEKTLTKARFLVNILEKKELRRIANEKKISYIKVNLSTNKFKFSNGQLKSFFTNSKEEKEIILTSLLDSFYSSKKTVNTENDFYEYALEYILLKIYKITNYTIYNEYRLNFKDNLQDQYYENSEITIINDDNLKYYFYLLSQDTSHNTFKLRQALYYIISGYLYNKDLLELIEIDSLYSKISSNLKSIKEELRDKDGNLIFGLEFSINESLPSFFETELYFSKEPTTENSFSHLSSGEKQKIFSISSIIYHLRNLYSISRKIEKNQDRSLIQYNNINIIFDEIELYFHPQFQKSFIKDLLESIEVLNGSYVNKLNIIFLTHSPFILSDIPKQNVLFLDGGEIRDFKKRNTFAANISTLLSDSFFIDNGLIGDFAIKKINEVIDFLNGKNKEMKVEDCKSIIQLIDEPILQKKLIEMYSEKFPSEERLSYLKKELKRLQEEIREEEKRNLNSNLN